MEKHSVFLLLVINKLKALGFYFARSSFSGLFNSVYKPETFSVKQTFVA